MNELKHKREFYTCKRLKLLKFLLDRGFEPYETIPDPSNWHYNWWQFKNSPELELAIDEYFANK